MPEDNPVQQTQHSFDFWKLAVKWYFFPILYIILAVLFVIISIIKENGEFSDFEGLGGTFLLTLYVLPNGLIFLFMGLDSYIERKIGEEFLQGFILIFPIVFHIFWIASVVIVQFFKIKRGKIIRWLVIAVFLAMLLSFIGCTQNLLTGGKSFNF